MAVTAAGIPLSTTVMQAGVVGLAILSVVAVVARWRVVRATPLDGALGVLGLVLLLSTLASGHPTEAVGWVRPWVVVTYFVVFWWLEDVAHARRMVRVLLIAASLAAAYGILQHFTGVDWYRDALGRAREVAPRQPGDGYFAVVGFFKSYLTYGHVMTIPFAFALAASAAGQLMAMGAAGLMLVSIVFSTARGAWLASIAVAVATAVAGRTRRALLIGVALAVVAGGALLANPDLRAQAAHMFELTGQNAARVAIYQANLDIIREHPVLGLGFGRYRTAARPYYDARPAADRRSHAHSNYLQLAAEAGLLGLAAFMWVFMRALTVGWTAVREAADADGRVVAVGAWAAMVGFLVGGVTQYTFGDNEVALAMWFTLALLMRLAPDA